MDLPFRAFSNECTNPIVIDSSDDNPDNNTTKNAESDSGKIIFDKMVEAQSVSDVQLVQDPGDAQFSESEPMATSTQLDGVMFQRKNKQHEKRPTPPVDDGTVPGPSTSRDTDSGPSAQHHQMIQR